VKAFDGARIVGIYTTVQGRVLAPRTGFSLALEALQGALDDAGMTLDEIDGFGSRVYGYPEGDHYWSHQLKREWKWSDRSIRIGAILDAARLITEGYLNAAAFVFGGVRPTQIAVAPWTESKSEWTGWPGAFPVQPVQFGLVARRYIHEVGPRAVAAMAEVAASIRNFGHINPDAVYFGRGPFTAEDVLASRYVAEPLTLLMCSAVTDGGCAMIVARADRAADARKKGVRVICGESKTNYPPYHEPPTLDGYYERAASYRETVARAGLGLEDIDAVEFYDHFSSHVVMQYEQFGFCGKGEGPDLVLSGAAKLGGRFPTCTDGGNLSFTHPGFPIVFRYIEAVRQLRGEVKDLCPGWAAGNHTYDPSVCRKVKDARLAFVSSPGTPTLQGSMLVLGRD
jgi:acetyl-CoA acetyltransferase